MSVFTIKSRDTRPILEVVLRNPDGSVHDLTGTTAWKLHIRTAPTAIFTRDMAIEGVETNGTLRYAWTVEDWDATNPAGALPANVRVYKPVSLEMEYEVFGGTARLTFPNDGYDLLKITGDVTAQESLGWCMQTFEPVTLTATGGVT